MLGGGLQDRVLPRVPIVRKAGPLSDFGLRGPKFRAGGLDGRRGT